MIKNHISDNLYYKLFSKSSEEKCIVHENAIKTAQLFSNSPSIFALVSFCNHCFLFHQSRDTSAIRRPSVLCLVYAEALARSYSSKKGVHKNLAKFRGKHMCWNLFLIKLQASGLVPYFLSFSWMQKSYI